MVAAIAAVAEPIRTSPAPSSDPSRIAANLMQHADRNISKTIQFGNVRLGSKRRCAFIALHTTDGD
jgi:hypothetical protein